MTKAIFFARADRVAELGDFLDALMNEWNCRDPEMMAEEIRRFMASAEGLESYSIYAAPDVTESCGCIYCDLKVDHENCTRGDA